MKSTGILVLKLLVFLAIANVTFVNAQAQKTQQPLGLQPVAQMAEYSRTHGIPQASVVCTGWHALCSASYDCQIKSDKEADCDCLRVNETNIVETSSIQDPAVKLLTQFKCTKEHPCDVDEAPVCKAIKYGQYEVDHVKYDWVSTFSYRGWCDLLKVTPKACVPWLPGYTGNRNWAICDLAPCTEIQNPSNPNKPLSCQCRVQDSAFLGTNGSCTGDNGGIMSSSPLWTWDFQTNTYRISIPGLEYVQGACASLQSDPWPPPRQSGNPHR